MIFFIDYLETIYTIVSLAQFFINSLLFPFYLHILHNKSKVEMKHYKIFLLNSILSIYVLSVIVGLLRPTFVNTPNFTVLISRNLMLSSENTYRGVVIFSVFIIFLSSIIFISNSVFFSIFLYIQSSFHLQFLKDFKDRYYSFFFILLVLFLTLATFLPLYFQILPLEAVNEILKDSKGKFKTNI